jgi:AraC family transcriptional regulator
MGRRLIFGHGDFFGTIRRHHAIPGVAMSHRIAAGDVAPHAHDDAHFVWVTGGEYVTTAGDPAPKDEAVFVYNPVGTTHCDHFAGGRGSFFAVSIAAGQMRQWQTGTNLPDEPRHVRGKAARGVTRKLMQECWDAPDSPLVLEGLCLELIGATAVDAETDSGAMPPWLKSAREALEERNVGISLGAVARGLGVHPVHLTRSFRYFFRCTPGEYLRSVRLERAARYLSRSRLALAEVALASGFTDQSHFTKRFARAFGVTPGEYRRLTIM